MRIVLCYPVQRKHLEQISSTATDCEVVDAGQEHVARELLAADIFCGHAKVPVPWDEVAAAGRLQWIQSSAAGLDHCLTPAVQQSGIHVTSASGLFADAVAEQSLALTLGLLRGLPTFFRQQQARIFERRPTADLHGRTVGIVGFGGNGRRLAKVLAAFQTRILATDVFPENKPDYVRELWPAEDLDRLLPLVDLLFLCVPLTDTTHSMIDERALKLMKPSAWLVNVARGAVVVEADLVEALQTRRLAGAGLDVTEVEPLPADSPLWQMPNVLITPHVGAQSATRIDDTTDLFCENLRRFLEGERLWNLVDKRLGFPRPTFVWTPKSRAE
jgi:D-3-phosphoglycerate dehydrogenase